MSSGDVALLKEVEGLMPDSSMKPRFLDSEVEDISSQLHSLSQRVSKTSADPAVRRAATAVLDELRCHFGEESSHNARTVLAAHLARFVADLVEKENAREALHWWMEFLLKIEDARPFTRSNWAHASTFEEVLSRCRLTLLDLKLEDVRPQLRLREALREVHNSARHAADDLLEVLYIGLRTKPAMDRFSYLDLCQCLKAGLCGSKAFWNLEDQIIFHILDMEKSNTVDLLAGCFLPECAKEDIPEDAGRSAAGIAARRHVQELVRELEETVRNRRDRTDRRTGIFLEACVQAGKEAWMAFWELHGLYCLLSALLKRLEICSSAVQDYASFICFLPVHQAALLDSDQLLPHLQARIAEKTKILMATYEVLPRPSAPPKRALFLEKCRALLHQLTETVLPCRMATEALQHVTPQATLQDFYLWRETDQRWKQFARLQLAARVLLKPEQLEALQVQSISRYLSDGPVDSGNRLAIQDIDESTPDDGCAHSEVTTGNLVSLRCFIDEDTRLHQAVCKLAMVGELGQNAWQGALRTAAMVNERTKHLFPHERVQLAPVSGKVSELVDVFCKITGVPGAESTVPRPDFQEMEWIVLDRSGKEIDTWSMAEFTVSAQTEWAEGE